MRPPLPRTQQTHRVLQSLKGDRYAWVTAPGGYRLSEWLYRPYLELVGSASHEDFVRLSWMDGTHEEVVEKVEATARGTALVVLRDLDMLEGKRLARALEQLVLWFGDASYRRQPWARSALLVCSGLSEERLQFRARGWTNEPATVDYVFALRRFGERHHLTGGWSPPPGTPLDPVELSVEGHYGLMHAVLEVRARGWTADEVRARLAEQMHPLAAYVRNDLQRRVPNAIPMLKRAGDGAPKTSAHEVVDALLRWDVVREGPRGLRWGPEPWLLAVRG